MSEERKFTAKEFLTDMLAFFTKENIGDMYSDALKEDVFDAPVPWKYDYKGRKAGYVPDGEVKLPGTYREWTDLMKKNNPFYATANEGTDDEITRKAFYAWCGAKLFIDNMFLAYGVDQKKVAEELISGEDRGAGNGGEKI